MTSKKADKKYAPEDAELEKLETEAREGQKGLWADPRPKNLLPTIFLDEGGLDEACAQKIDRSTHVALTINKMTSCDLYPRRLVKLAHKSPRKNEESLTLLMYRKG